MTVESGNFHDAMPSWNGFSYQGKVGLYVALLKMLQLGNDSDALDRYSIEYEWLEDFSIKQDGKYESIHQVKHYGGNAYKNALEKLAKKKKGLLDKVNLKVVVDDVYPKMKTPEKNALCSEIYIWMEGNGVVNGQRKINACSTIVNLPIKLSAYEESLKQFLSSWQHFDSDIESVQAAYFHISADHKPTMPEGISKYPYGLLGAHQKKEYCDDDELSQRIKHLIEIWRQKTGDDLPLNKDAPFLHLLGLIDTHVSGRHNDKTASKEIMFSEIAEKLSSKDITDTSDEYKAFCLKKIFVEAYEGYRIVLTGEKSAEQQIERLDALMNSVNQNYEGSSFLEFARMISPDGSSSGFDQNGMDILAGPNIEKYYFHFFERLNEFTTMNPTHGDKTYHPSTLDIDREVILKTTATRVVQNVNKLNKSHDRLRFVAKLYDGLGEEVSDLFTYHSQSDTTEAPNSRDSSHFKEPPPISLHKDSSIIERLNGGN